MDDLKIISNNKKAKHDYFIEDTIEAGIVLTGTEIKSIRQGKINLKDSYCQVRKGEVFAYNIHISHFTEGNRYNHDPLRVRKLLLKKKTNKNYSRKAIRKRYKYNTTEGIYKKRVCQNTYIYS